MKRLLCILALLLVHRSLDGGQTWTPIAIPDSGYE
jgi:hypothetical protein